MQSGDVGYSVKYEWKQTDGRQLTEVERVTLQQSIRSSIWCLNEWKYEGKEGDLDPRVKDRALRRWCAQAATTETAGASAPPVADLFATHCLIY